MATSFKTFDNRDSVVTRNLLHEAIPITGTIVSGTYTNKAGTEYNIKDYSHGMFQSVYDYPYLSSSANHIFDLTMGYSPSSSLSQSLAADYSMQPKKINLYNQMAQVLVGFDENGAVRQFDEDGDLTGGRKIRECYFFNFARLLSKDEIKKGSFSLTLGVNSSYETGSFRQMINITDGSGSTSYKVNSPAGEYGILRASGSSGVWSAGRADPLSGSTPKCGLVYYQAGIAVITASVFMSGGLDGRSPYTAIAGRTTRMRNKVQLTGPPGAAGPHLAPAVLTGSTIDVNCDALRHRIKNVSFNNSTELNSAVYFCRVNNTDFNYSANPTYLKDSKLVVKTNAQDLPVTYVTTVGLYSADNELLAIAKLSEPLKKDPTTEFTLRVRLDY
jgi:hypothetical protein